MGAHPNGPLFEFAARTQFGGAAPEPPPALRKPIAYQETSRQAYQQHARGKIDRKILESLAETGAVGMTDEAIEQRTGIKHQTISGNRRHLVEDGFVRDSGRKAIISTGRKAILWVLA